MTKPKKDWVKEEVKKLGITVTDIPSDMNTLLELDCETLLSVPAESWDQGTGKKKMSDFQIGLYCLVGPVEDKWELFQQDNASFLPSDINKIIVGLLALKDALREAGYNVDEEE